MKRNHEYDYFDKCIEYQHDYFALLTNVVEYVVDYEYDSKTNCQRLYTNAIPEYDYAISDVVGTWL